MSQSCTERTRDMSPYLLLELCVKCLSLSKTSTVTCTRCEARERCGHVPGMGSLNLARCTAMSYGANAGKMTAAHGLTSTSPYRVRTQPWRDDMRTINGKTKPKPAPHVRLSRNINRAGPAIGASSYFAMTRNLWAASKRKRLSGSKRDELLHRLRERLV